MIDVIDIFSRLSNRFGDMVLLESMDAPTKFAKQSIICFKPRVKYRIGEFFERNEECFPRDLDVILGIFRKDLQELEKKELKIKVIDGDADVDPKNNFNGGIVGATGFDFISLIEPTLALPEKELLGIYALYEDGLVIDHVKKTFYYFHRGVSRLKEILGVLGQGGNGEGKNMSIDKSIFIAKDIQRSDSFHDFIQNVETIKGRIVQGEFFQAVYSQSLSFTGEGNPFMFYEELRKVNPSPFMFFLELDEVKVIGSSPELLISKTGKQLSTFPIAGTRKVAGIEKIDERSAMELLNDEKELAEHNMLVDLARNDIGKVSKIGSVTVPYYLQIEKFSHVMHIVSEVRGEITGGLDQFDAFCAMFPAGTVSGAPKLRAIETIHELESTPRELYAGSVGFFGCDGTMEQAITIRSMFGKGDQYKIQAGAGIVYDSIPEKEYEETLNKLGAMLQMLNIQVKEVQA